MRRILGLTFALVLGVAASTPHPQQPVRLAIIVVVDQLRADLLDRYDDLFTGGFRRLHDQGFRFTEATHDHWWTETAPGHTTIATGAYPRTHGIVLNDFSLQVDDELAFAYSFADSLSPILGLPDRPGRSPANLRRPSFAEWLLWKEPRARVATVSRKDRAAIPLAGHTPAAAFWIDIESGRFVTSQYYATAYPAWLDDFNDRVMPFLYSDSVWTLRVPPAARPRARPDSAPYENGGRDVTFPHSASERPQNQSYNAWVAETPLPDLAALMLARRMAGELELGRQGHVDFLGISLSQTDAVGHSWGPLSLEQLDNLLRIDQALGEFMDWLDQSVGRGQWMLALSADHGVMTAPEYLREQGIDAWRLTREQTREQATILAGLSDPDLRPQVVRQLEMLPFVADVVSADELSAATAPADSFIPLLRNSVAEGRSSRSLMALGLQLRNRENVLTTRSDAASHGTPYYYDRHVPLIFFGPGIAPGVSSERAATADLAPTLAELIGVPAPDGLDGVSRAATLLAPRGGRNRP